MTKKTTFIKKLSDFKSIIVVIGFFIFSAFTGYFWLHSEFASAKDVKQIEQSVLYMQLEYQKTSKENRLYKIQERYECEDLNFYPENCKLGIPQTIKEEIKELQEEIIVIDSKMKKLEE